MFRLNCRRLARSCSFFCSTCCSPEPPGGGRGLMLSLKVRVGREADPGGCCWGSQGKRWERGVERSRGEAGCCQQVPLFPDLLWLKVTHFLASWGTSFEMSFPSLPEAGFRPCPCFFYMIPWITVFIDNITPGTQRGKVKAIWMPYSQVFLFSQELSETSIFTVA